MRNSRISRCANSFTNLTVALCALFWPLSASAHSFGRIYNLPVPIWLYLYGAAAALAASFLVIGYFSTVESAGRKPWQREWDLPPRPRTLKLLRGLSLALLLLCIATGLWGTRNAYGNFSMTFFWVIFVLGFSYLSALVGDLYPLINPLETMSAGLTRVFKTFSQGRVRYPQRLGCWPALGFYMAFIWIELFAATRPFTLSLILLAYVAINLLGVWLIGRRDWFRHCEFFGVFLGLIAAMAPLSCAGGKLRLRAPFSGLLERRADSLGLLVFILFMLSSTGFDGLRETVPWVKLFWVDLFSLLQPWLGDNPVRAYPLLRPLYLGWQTFWLLASPFLYLAVYLGFVWLAKLLGHSQLPLRELALRFGMSLLPIALVYNVTHYFTLIITQGVKIIPLLSDPFGWGWNLFGTARWLRAPIIPDAGWVWHTQVALILIGHIVSVYLAHVEALRIFPTRRAGTLSQLPMLALMMLFTTAGLWILAQPIQGGM